MDAIHRNASTITCGITSSHLASHSQRRSWGSSSPASCAGYGDGSVAIGTLFHAWERGPLGVDVPRPAESESRRWRSPQTERDVRATIHLTTTPSESSASGYERALPSRPDSVAVTERLGGSVLGDQQFEISRERVRRELLEGNPDALRPVLVDEHHVCRVLEVQAGAVARVTAVAQIAKVGVAIVGRRRGGASRRLVRRGRGSAAETI